jgi:hypothetical protein
MLTFSALRKQPALGRFIIYQSVRISGLISCEILFDLFLRIIVGTLASLPVLIAYYLVLGLIR